jgi:hypothetical protein
VDVLLVAEVCQAFMGLIQSICWKMMERETLQTILKKVAFKLNDVGMVTDAVWEDMIMIQKKDLIVVGDWMAPKYINTGRRLPNINLTLRNIRVLERS